MKNNITKLDNIKKAKFLTAYKQPEVLGNITLACEVAKISRQTYYLWLEKDEIFREKVYDAKMTMCDDAEATLYSRGMEKDTTALIYWLKNRHPDFREKPQMLQQINYGSKSKQENIITFVSFKEVPEQNQ